MKRFLPFLILVVGILVLGGVFFVVKNKNNAIINNPDDESQLAEVPLSQRPYVSLTPTSDGHYLDLKVQNIKIKDASTCDYLLLYQVPDGPTQGVPGTLTLNSDTAEENLLLGSESSGHYRYDEGVETGTLSLSFRNSAGKLVAKFTTDFHLQNTTDALSTNDESFKFQLDEVSKEYFVTMNTIGLPSDLNKNVDKGPFGIFSSSPQKLQGKVTSSGQDQIQFWNGSEWVNIDSQSSTDFGTFVFTAGQ